MIERFCSLHHVPRVLVDPSTPLDLSDLEGQFRSRVLGQHLAVRTVVEMIGAIKAGLSDMRRPFGVFLFAGPTGVGKTHLAQLLAEYLFGSRERVIRLNMADFAEDASAATLFGSPEGYRPSDQRGVLHQRVVGHPFAVLLLDEFEKAPRKVHDRFMQLFDEGSFTNGLGEQVSCRSMIIIATSNAGAEVYHGSVFGFSGSGDSQALMRELDRRLESCFRFEFLNRFDQIVHFQPLSRQDIRAIALRELEQLEERGGFRQRGLRLEIDESVLDWAAAYGYDPDYGARFLRRMIERHVTTALADALVREALRPGASVELMARGGKIVARAQQPREEVRAAREGVTLPLGTTSARRVMGRAELVEQAAQVLASAAALIEALAERRRIYSELLEKINQPGFWRSEPSRTATLEEFRRLDASIQTESRLAQPIHRLQEATESGRATHLDLDPLARLVESAGAALRDWHDRLAEEGPGAVWLVVSNSDPLRPSDRWIEDLVRMELAWCGKLRLSAAVVGYEIIEDQLNRVAIEAQGPGAASYLAMEEGLHKLNRAADKGGDARARIDIIAQGPAPRELWPEMTSARRKPIRFGLEPTVRGRLELTRSGLTVELLGVRGEMLGHLLHDLRRQWEQTASDTPQIARNYGESGTGARDPRTGVVVPRLRDVLRGGLDPFLDAWRQWLPAEEHTEYA